MMPRRLFAALVMLLAVLPPALGDDLFEPANEPPYFPPARMVPVYAEAKTDGPAIAGKPLKFWVERLLHQEEAIRELASEAINKEFHAEAIWNPYYCFSEEAIHFRDKCQKDYKPLVPRLLHVIKHSKDENVIASTASLLAKFGPEAQSTLPDLRRLAVQPELDEHKRMMVVFALLYVTPEDQAVSPICMKSFNNSQGELKELFTEPTTEDALTGVGFVVPVYAAMLAGSGHTKVEIPYLTEVALGNYPSTLRLMAIGTLGELQFDAKAAVPSLHKLLKHKDKYIRLCAAGALLHIEQDSALLPAIIESLEVEGKEREDIEKSCNEYLAEKEKEIKFLAEIGENDEFVLPMLIGGLKHGSGFYRRQAIRDLGIVGAAAKSALPELRNALKDPDEDTRKLAAEAIEKIERSMAKTSKN